MTAIAQNPQLDALLAKVKEQVTACGLSEAILVDDKLVQELTDVQWIEAVSKVQAEDANTYEKLKKLYEAEGQQKVEELPNEAIWDDAVALVEGSTSEAAVKIIKEKRYQEPALTNLTALLELVGLKPICYTRVTDNDPPRTGQLYFLDYRMQGNDQTAGLDAIRLLGGLVKRPGDTPPSAVLMSRGKDEHPTQQEWEGVARKAGYYRFNFRYLDKVKAESGKAAFLFFLHELLISYPVGKEYYTQLQGLQKAAHAAADIALEQIRALSPAEFGHFAGKFLGDDSGRKASRHILELFLGLLDAQVKDDETLESSFRKFAAILAKKPMLATTDPDIHTLHKLHTRLLYDCSRWARSGPVEFGDIYYRFGERDVYYLVITPECDLDPREVKGTWAPKAEKIMLLRGEPKDRPPTPKDGDVVGILFPSDTAPRWIWWGLRDHMLVPAADLIVKKQEQVAGWPPLIGNTGLPLYGSHDGRFLKWGQLRKTEAEHVQQEYVSDIASVGLDDIPGKIELLPVELWHRQQNQPDHFVGNITIIETVNQKDEDSPYWAFAEGCEALLCSDAPADVMLTFEMVVEMRKPLSKSKFIHTCEKNKLYYKELKDEPRLLVRSIKSVPGNWKPQRQAAQPATGAQRPDGSSPGDIPPPDGQPVTSIEPQLQPREVGGQGSRAHSGDLASPPSKVKFEDVSDEKPPDMKK